MRTTMTRFFLACAVFAMSWVWLGLVAGEARADDAGTRPEAGAPALRPTPGSPGSLPPGNGDREPDTGDAGAPSHAIDAGGEVLGAVAPTGAPVVRIPQTEAEKAEGSPIAGIEISGNRRVAREDVPASSRVTT